MTLRRIIAVSTAATALSIGALAVPSTVSAAPATPSSLAPAYAALGRDVLAARADAGMNAWFAYAFSGQKRAFSRFQAALDVLAVEAAARVGADPARMRAAWMAADPHHQVALMAAMTQLGTPYRRNTSKPGVGFDCSGLTTWAWAQAGVTLPRQSRSQINNVTRVSREDAQAGDLIYYPGHVSLWLGVDNFILHAPYSGRSVEFSHIRESRSVLFGNPVG